MLTNSINCGPGLIPSQVTIFISSMSWYCALIIINAERYPRVDYPIVFDRLLSKIHQLEEDQVKVESEIDLNTNKLVEDEFELLLNMSKIILKQEDCAVVFAVVAKKIYGSGYLDKIKESLSGLLFEALYYSTVIKVAHQLSLSHCTDCVLSYDAELKRLRRLRQVLNNIIVVARLFFRLAIASYLHWYFWKFLIHLEITLLL